MDIVVEIELPNLNDTVVLGTKLPENMTEVDWVMGWPAVVKRLKDVATQEVHDKLRAKGAW